MAFVLSLLVPHLFFVWCRRNAVLHDCGISLSISSVIFMLTNGNRSGRERTEKKVNIFFINNYVMFAHCKKQNRFLLGSRIFALLDMNSFAHRVLTAT